MSLAVVVACWLAQMCLIAAARFHTAPCQILQTQILLSGHGYCLSDGHAAAMLFLFIATPVAVLTTVVLLGIWLAAAMMNRPPRKDFHSA